MEDARRNVLVGVFVLLGLGAMAGLVILFGRGPTWLLRTEVYPLHVHFDEVAGVREGTLVTIKGIEIGRVDSVALAGAPLERPSAARLVGVDAGVDVLLQIKKEFLIPRGSVARTTEPMLGSGRPPIEILPGPADAEPLAAGAVIEGRVRRALDTLFPGGVVGTFETTARQIGDAAEALTPVLAEIKGLVEQRTPRSVDQPGGPQGNLSSAVARLDATFRHFNEVLGDEQVKSQLRETVANAREISQRGKQVAADLEAGAKEARQLMTDSRQFVARADQTLQNVDSRVDSVSRELTDSLDRVDRFMDNMVDISHRIASGEGNLGRLVMDSKLYEALQITAERLALAVDEFRGMIAEWREKGMRARL